MSSLYVVFSERYLSFDFGYNHPYKPEFIKKTFEALENYLSFVLVEAKSIDDKILEQYEIHSRSYINRVIACSQLKIYYLSEYSADTPCFKGIYEWGLAYSGGTVSGCEIILEELTQGNIPTVYNLVGGFHHAKYNSDGGFCVFNDCALAIEYLRGHGLRVLYLDIDGHAGDGTFLILYNKPVPKISIHESPHFLYPGRGFIEEVGSDDGYGYTINVPLPPRSGDTEFISALNRIVKPILNLYDPDAVILQMGVDGYFDDPLTHLNYTYRAYMSLARLLAEFKKPIFACPGGGYSHDAPFLRTIILGILSNQEHRISDIIKTLERASPKRILEKNLAEEIISEIENTHPIWSILKR